MYKLLSKISNDKLFVCTGIIIALMSSGGISLTLLNRDYALTECFLAGFTYVMVSFFLAENKFGMKKLLFFSFITALFLLSCYFSIIYVVIFSSATILYFTVSKKFNILLNFLLMLLFSVITVLAIYPSYFNFEENNEHYQGIYQKLKNLISQIGYKPVFKDKIFVFLSKYCYYEAVIYSLALIYLWESLYKNEKNKIKYQYSKKDTIVFMLTVLSLIWIIIVFSIQPYEIYRYVMPVLPVASILLTLFIVNIKSRLFRVILIALYIVFPFLQLGKDFYYNSCNIENLHIPYSFNHKFNNEDNIVFHSQSNDLTWGYPNFYIYLPNETKNRFEKTLPDKNYDWKSYKFVTPMYINQPAILNERYNIYAIEQ